MRQLVRRPGSKPQPPPNPPARPSLVRRPEAAPAALVAPRAPVPNAEEAQLARRGGTVPLHVKWRPAILEDVIGQPGVVANLTQLFKSGRIPHSYLFSGPAGTGKTTLGRIIGAMLGCTGHSIIDVDGARYGAAESMREVVAGAQYKSLGASDKKVIIVDECHNLSKQAWDSLLLTSEEPPEHLYWVFCTTAVNKVPKTVQTRCHAYALKPVDIGVLIEHLTGVVEVEKLHVEPSFVEMAARRADGSVRQALVFLSMLDGISDPAMAAKLVNDYEQQEDGPITLARWLVQGGGGGWAQALKILEPLKDTNPESIRMMVMAYTSSVLFKDTSPEKAGQLLAILGAFASATGYNSSEKMAPVLQALGFLFLSE